MPTTLRELFADYDRMPWVAYAEHKGQRLLIGHAWCYGAAERMALKVWETTRVPTYLSDRRDSTSIDGYWEF